MRLRNLLATFIFVIGIGNYIQAQDIHFTTWDMAPLTVNPAFSGSYLGSFRVGGVYRDQWFGFEGSQGNFTTPTAFIDAPIIRGLRKNDWVGIGLMFFSDKAGTFDLGYSATKISAAYHLGLNKKQTSVLTLGFQWGQGSYDFTVQNPSDVVAQDVTEFNMLADAGDPFQDYKVGVLFKSLLNKSMNVSLGASGGYLSTPRVEVLSASGTSGGGGGVGGIGFENPLLLQLHGQFGIGMTEKWSLTPQFFYQTKAGASEVSLQAYGGYKFNKDYTLRPGIGYRMTNNDAVEFLLGVDIRDNLRTTLAYDLTVSELAGSTGGALEIGVSYIGKIFKKPDIKPAILCPRL